MDELEARAISIQKIATETCDNEGVVEYNAGLGWDAAAEYYREQLEAARWAMLSLYELASHHQWECPPDVERQVELAKLKETKN